MSTQATHESGAQAPADGVGAVGHETKNAASQVAGTAGDEARKVARETSDQARQLWQQTRSDLSDQASTQQDRAAQGLRQLSDQLRSMVDGAEDDGMARGLVDDVARRAGDAAGWLEGRDPGAILDEAKQFAQRRPGTFLAVAAGLGVLAGRMSRGLVDEKRADEPEPSESGAVASTGSPVAGATGVAAGADSLPVDAFASEGLATTPRLTQPVEPDGTPAPIGADGHLTMPADDVTHRGRE